MWKSLLAFLAGVVTAPYVTRALKPVTREVVKGSLLVGHQLQRITAEVREDLEDLAAEAAAGIGSEKKSDSSKKSK